MTRSVATHPFYSVGIFFQIGWLSSRFFELSFSLNKLIEGAGSPFGLWFHLSGYIRGGGGGGGLGGSIWSLGHDIRVPNCFIVVLFQ